MKLKDCTICGFALTEIMACPACDAAEAIVDAGGCLAHYQEALAEEIGNLLAKRDWNARPISLRPYPRFA